MSPNVAAYIYRRPAPPIIRETIREQFIGARKVTIAAKAHVEFETVHVGDIVQYMKPADAGIHELAHAHLTNICDVDGTAYACINPIQSQGSDDDNMMRHFQISTEGAVQFVDLARIMRSCTHLRVGDNISVFSKYYEKKVARTLPRQIALYL